MGKVRASAGGAICDHSGVQGSVVQTGFYLDEVGRSRDAGTGAIVMPGFRRLPPAADITYVERLERQNAALEMENQELRIANRGLQASKNAGAERITQLENERRMMLEQIDTLRAQVAVSFEESRNNEISKMFLGYDNAELRSTIQTISGQNTALASGLIGSDLDRTAGKLFSQGSLSDPTSAAFDQHIQAANASQLLPTLPTNPLERAKYAVEDRVKCLLAKVGVLPGMVLSAAQCCDLQAAFEDTHPETLQDRCQNTCGADGLPYEQATDHFKSFPSASLARAEKMFGLTRVHYR